MMEDNPYMIGIRPMTGADYDGAYALWLRTPGMGLNTLDDSREGIERYLRRNPTTCFVAECMGDIVGVILAGHDGRRGYLYHTAVLPDYRRRGIGEALLRHAMEALEAEGIHKVALVAFRENETGNAFWEQMGFQERTDLSYRNRNIHALEKIKT